MRGRVGGGEGGGGLTPLLPLCCSFRRRRRRRAALSSSTNQKKHFMVYSHEKNVTTASSPPLARPALSRAPQTGRAESIPSPPFPPSFTHFLRAWLFSSARAGGRGRGTWPAGGACLSTRPPRVLFSFSSSPSVAPPCRERRLSANFPIHPWQQNHPLLNTKKKLLSLLLFRFFFFNCYQCFNALPLHPPLSLVPHALSTTTPSITTTSTHSLHTKDKKKCASCLFDKNQNLLRTSFLFIGGKRETLCFSILLSLWTIVAHIQLDRPVCVFLWTKTRNNDRKTHFKMKPFFPSCKIT